jgi:sugar phosphate isomerase/epimerase
VTTGAPFLLGTTSYVLPDHLLPNVRLLAPLVDDIELILFEGEGSNLPTAGQVREMAGLAADSGSGFTVHLPLDTGLGEPEPRRRVGAQEIVLRVLELMLPVGPRAFVVHPEPPATYLPPTPGARPARLDSMAAHELEAWLAALRDSLTRLQAAAGAVPLALENLQYPFAWLEPLLAELDLAVTMDVGHLLLRGDDVAAHAARFGPRLAVVHLHGLRDGQDHCALDAFSREELEAVLDSVAGAGSAHGPVVVTLEVFGARDTAISLDALGRVLGGETAGRFSRAAAAIRAAAAQYGPADR